MKNLLSLISVLSLVAGCSATFPRAGIPQQDRVDIDCDANGACNLHVSASDFSVDEVRKIADDFCASTGMSLSVQEAEWTKRASRTTAKVQFSCI